MRNKNKIIYYINGKSVKYKVSHKVTDTDKTNINIDFNDDQTYYYDTDFLIGINISNHTDDIILDLNINNTITTLKTSNNFQINPNEIYKNISKEPMPIGLRTITLTFKRNNVVLMEKEYSIVISTPETTIGAVYAFENKSPYISSYYLKPILEKGEDIILDYYIDDYDYSYNRHGNTTYSYTIYATIDGKEDIVINNVKAGDNQINFGSFDTDGERTLSIYGVDQYGRESHILFYDVLIKSPTAYNEYVMTNQDLTKYNIVLDDKEEIQIHNIDIEGVSGDIPLYIKGKLEEIAQTYTVPSGKYCIFLADTDGDGEANYYKNASTNSVVKYATDYNKEEVESVAKTTTEGLNRFILEKVNEGYNKIKLLNGVYRVSNVATHRQMGSVNITTDNTTLDLNGSTIKLNGFTGNTSLVMSISHAKNSHIINGTIEGDYYTHDYVNSPDNSEWNQGFGINGGCKYSSFENVTLKNSSGYGFVNGISNSIDNSQGYTKGQIAKCGTFTLGDIDRETGLPIESDVRTTCDFVDISKCGRNNNGNIEISTNIYLGYQGNPCGNFAIIHHYYDDNKNYIKSQTTHQYRRTICPINTYYLKVTLLSTATPDNLSSAYWNIPTNCAFKNMEVINTRGTGSANCAMRNMLMENINVTCCGQNITPTGMDFEDGWDMMQDVTVRNVNFYQTPGTADLLTCAGHNIIVENMKNGSIYFWERTRNAVVRNCEVENFNTKIDAITRSGDRRVSNCTINSIYSNQMSEDESLLNKNPFVIKDSAIKAVDGIVRLYNCEVKNMKTGIFEKCNINSLGEPIGYLDGVKMYNCIFTNDTDDRSYFKFNGNKKNYFKECEFKGKWDFKNNNKFNNASFIQCNFDDIIFYPNVVFNGTTDKIYLHKCNINTTNNHLFYLSPFAYTKGANLNIEVKECDITQNFNGNSSIIYLYAKPNGVISITNSSIIINNTNANKYIVDGYPSNKDLIEDCTIDLRATVVSDGVIDYKHDFKGVVDGGYLKLLK